MRAHAGSVHAMMVSGFTQAIGMATAAILNMITAGIEPEKEITIVINER